MRTDRVAYVVDIGPNTVITEALGRDVTAAQREVFSVYDLGQARVVQQRRGLRRRSNLLHALLVHVRISLHGVLREHLPLRGARKLLQRRDAAVRVLGRRDWREAKVVPVADRAVADPCVDGVARRVRQIGEQADELSVRCTE